MVEVRRKPVTFDILDNLQIPDEFERLEFTHDISADDFEWIKLGHVSEVGIDLTGVYVPEENMLYFLSSLIHNSKGIHIFICRLRIQITDDSVSVIYAEVGKNLKDKERTRFLSAWTRIGFVIKKDDEAEEFQVNPRSFEWAINDLIKYAKISVRPHRQPENISSEMSAYILTSVEKHLTERQFFHLMWGSDDRLTDGRWFAYMEDLTMYWHRSWTGKCQYQIKFREVDSGYLIYEIATDGHPAFEPLDAIQLVDDLIGHRIYEYEKE